MNAALSSLFLLALAAPGEPSDDAPIRIMPIGDSITETNTGHASWRYWFYNDLIAAGYAIDLVGSKNGVFGGPPLYSEFDADHEAHSAWQTATMAASIAGFASAADPEIALLHMGNTDLVQGTPASFALLGITQILDALRSARPNVCILLAQVVPIESGGLTLTTVPPFNATLPQLVALYDQPASRLLLVDQYSGYDPDVDSYDGFHPSQSGEQKIAMRWQPKLLPLLATLRPPDLTPGAPLAFAPNGPNDERAFTFDAVEGMRLVLTTKPQQNSKQKSRVTLFDPADSVVASFTLHYSKSEQKAVKLLAAGRHRLVFDSFSGNLGPLLLGTARKLPKNAKDHSVKLIPDRAGIARTSLRALPNTQLTATIAAALPPGITFFLATPDGAELEVTSYVTASAGGLLLGPLPLRLPGKYVLSLHGLAGATQKVPIALVLDAP